MFKVLFLPNLKSVELEPGCSVIEAAERAGVLIDASCNGTGTCGKCKIKVNSPACIPLSSCEEKLLSDYEKANGYHLACQLTVESDMDIAVPAVHGGSVRKKKMVKLPEQFEKDISIYKQSLKVKKAKMDYQFNDIERIREATKKPALALNRGLLVEIHPALEAMRGQVTLALRESSSEDKATLLAIEPGDSESECYGCAFDIGTTTVVGMLWNLLSGELVDVEARTNYQSIYGADVISRIQYSLEGEGRNNLETLQSKAVQCFNDIIEEICIRNGINPQHIYHACAVGNTTMSHLLMGVTPVSMSKTPFAPVFCEVQTVQAVDLGIGINRLADVNLLPNIAGHVGSDIVGMMLAVGMDSLKGSHIAIDIGTNGEVVAVKDGRMLCCSTAAGPAFEGATIHQGMRAAAGAIEKIEIDAEGVHVGTIDDAPAVGICGSGLIDAVAELLRVGVVEPSGRMLTREEAREKDLPEAIAKLITGEGVNAYFTLAELDEGDNIILTQSDVREVQLAKGAILAGIQTLMKELDMSAAEIDSIMLAGAFGNYIDKRSALRIGLLPQVDEAIIKAVGNAAGVGCSMALLSESERRHADVIAVETEHIELSMNPVFQDLYIDAMRF